MKISYAITVKDEIKEFKRLLGFLMKHIPLTDEIVIQQDIVPKGTNQNATQVTIHAADKSEENMGNNIKFIQYSLDGDFSSFKNNLNKFCTGDYIFQLDADELPSINLITNLHSILETNPEVELYKIPRENFVDGIESIHMMKWGWIVDEMGRINYPDFQGRIYMNKDRIFWKNTVHESITGATVTTLLPMNKGLDLIHRKTILKQEQQNAFYSTL